ncbi:DUF3450 domain-containing protein [Pseudoalteromonas luteoviolacea]|uniref:DUF3450 family protein n=1 Tax=Pseudoalteromonas luteoviolacea TaxID=43657 RepID=UPI001F26D73D|nr:DUF3450 family protein [Pseudoalteromonas luteoviolacea]MCF6439357.1 DUF3450 domain-containing protein [Pseudoalteromonas luteoviolacea]
MTFQIFPLSVKQRCLSIIILLFSTCSVQANDETKLIEQWLNLEKQKSALTAAWQQRKETLEQQIILLSKEQTSLKQLIAKNHKNQSSVSEQRELLASQKIKLEQSNAKLTTQLNSLSEYLKSVVTKLPYPLQQQWEKTLSKLDADSNSVRLEAALKLIKQAHDFDQRVVFHTGLIQINEHESILAEQVFLGLAHGWYISKNKQHLGYGKSIDDIFKWQHKDQMSIVLTEAHLTELTNILKNPTSAKYVQLPLAITASNGGAL